MNIRYYRLLITILICFTTNESVVASEPLKPIRTETPPIIDGVLSDAIWEEAPTVTGFITFSPDYGKLIDEQTVVSMAYDHENLYFAYRCYDTQRDKIKTSVSSRDNMISDDWICINLDSFNDQQALSAFYVNPSGIQGDSRFTAGNEDFSIDYVWYSAGKIDSAGYTVEVQLPLKSLRYTNTNQVTMSVFFERYISRRSEHSCYPAMDPAKGQAFLTQMRPMLYSDLKHYTLLELLPAVTYSNKSNLLKDRMVQGENKYDFSMTAKYGLTSDLILDGAINPDFSQVESDAGQVDANLRYALYYSEKRPFFLEGSENFTIAATTASELDPVRSIVHTRTIVDPIVGVKMTGKLTGKTTLASIYATDQLPEEMTERYGTYAHTPIVRVKTALTQDSYIGGIYAGMEMKDYFNRLIGLDGMVRTTDAGMLEFHGLYSRAKFTAATFSNDGYSLGFRYRTETRDLYHDFSVIDVSDNFNAGMGYVSRTGILQFTGLVRPRLYPKSEIIQRIDAELFSGQTLDKPSGRWETFNHVSIQNLFLGSLTVKVKYSYATEIFLGEKFKTGGFHILAGGQFTNAIYCSILYRYVDAIYYDDLLQGKSNRISAGLVIQPSEQLSSELTFTYIDFYRNSDHKKILNYPITREKITYQLNKYLFFRGIAEYNNYRRTLLTDFLASFTYIPGTVIYLGYGSIYEKIRWDRIDKQYQSTDRFNETTRGFFFKMSYLWRM